jgi:Protein of unknown function DUF86
MLPRDLVYVGHMLDMARKAVSKTQGISRETFDADENLRLALIHLIQMIGEAARQVSREFCNDHPDVRWADMIGCAPRSCTTTLGLMRTSCGKSSRMTYRSSWPRLSRSSHR